MVSKSMTAMVSKSFLREAMARGGGVQAAGLLYGYKIIQISPKHTIPGTPVLDATPNSARASVLDSVRVSYSRISAVQ